jgi:hypothetical protein
VCAHLQQVQPGRRRAELEGHQQVAVCRVVSLSARERVRTATGVWHAAVQATHRDSAAGGRRSRLAPRARSARAADGALQRGRRRRYKLLQPDSGRQHHLAQPGGASASRHACRRRRQLAFCGTFCAASSELLDTSARKSHQPSSLVPGKNGVCMASDARGTRRQGVRWGAVGKECTRKNSPQAHPWRPSARASRARCRSRYRPPGSRSPPHPAEASCVTRARMRPRLESPRTSVSQNASTETQGMAPRKASKSVRWPSVIPTCT